LWSFIPPFFFLIGEFKGKEYRRCTLLDFPGENDIVFALFIDSESPVYDYVGAEIKSFSKESLSEAFPYDFNEAVILLSVGTLYKAFLY